MEERNLKIAFGGPSGSGKTTLATYLKENFGVVQIQSYQTRQFTIEDRQEWKEKFGYDGDIGHRALINLQNQFPEFGVAWQKACLECRGNVIWNTTNFVMDRSPIDNVVYMLTQVSHNMDEREIQEFISKAQNTFMDLSHFVLIRVTNQTEVEKNNSRVDNIFYQRFISDVFEGVYKKYFANLGVPTTVLNVWDLDTRKDQLLKFINEQ